MVRRYKIRKAKKKMCMAGVFFILFLLLIALIKLVDVAAVGPQGTEIGLSHINVAFHEFTGVHHTLYNITELTGLIAIAGVAVFAFMGLKQWITRKNLWKVDYEILAMGVIFLGIFLIYIFFEKVIVDYRPVLMPGCDEPEASFPSSHTLMSCVVMVSSAMVLDRYVKNERVVRLLLGIAVLINMLTVIGRLNSGVHWLTDIIGGVLLSVSILYAFSAALDLKPVIKQ